MKNNKTEDYFDSQYQQKIKQVHESTKLYFQSIVVLGAGIIAAITALSYKNNVDTVIYIGIPLFLLSWFGCYIWIYSEHHMMRISLDYTEKLTAEKIGIKSKDLFLYHEDFLGVFNQAKFPPPFFKWWFSKRFRSVQWVFVLIGLPGVFLFAYCAYNAAVNFANYETYGLTRAVAYISFIAVTFFLLISITIQCVRRERILKARLGIISQWDIDEQLQKSKH